MRQPPNHRRAVISGLRELADYLSLHRDIPVPLIVEIDYFPHGNTDAEKRAEVDRIAKILGVTPISTAAGQHYIASRPYGAIRYRAITVSTKDRKRWEAITSYSDNIKPDDEPPEHSTQ